MKIAICGSMQYTDRMLEVQVRLNELGHEARVTSFASSYVGKSAEEIERLKLEHKYQYDAIRDYWNVIKECDAILVLNLDKYGIANYIGGNTLMEIGFAHVLNRRIFLLNPIPDIPFYKTEIEAVKPIIINGNLSLIC